MNVREHAISTLNLAREDISTPGGWTQESLGSWQQDSGPVCLLGAVARHNRNPKREVSDLIFGTLGKEATRRGFQGMVMFNDAQGRTVDDVVDFLNAAIRQIEEGSGTEDETT